MGTTIRWLHLTDLHVGMNDQDWLWPQMETKFRDDLKKIYDTAGPWDLVLFTGDLVHKGVEYAKLDKILDEIWTWFTDLGCDPELLTVPGNHDLQWRDAKDPVVRQLYRWEAESEVRDEFWNPANDEYRKPVSAAFAAYETWRRDTRRVGAGAQPGLLPGDFSYTFVKDGFRLGIVGLNSAFLQLTEKRNKGAFQGHMALHPKQFQAVCGGNGPKWAESHHACFLMTHHPPEWLNKESQEWLQGEIHESFQLHLCGHNHEIDVLQELPGGSEHAPLRWLGRSLFGLEKSSRGKLARSHGYVSGELRIGDDFQGEIQFMPRERRQQGKGGLWSLVPDHNVILPDDRRTRSFPIRIQPVPIVSRAGSPEDGGSVSDGGASGTTPTELLPGVERFLRELPGTRPDVHAEIMTALQQELPRVRTSDTKGPPTVDLLDVARRETVNEVLDALYRWLDRPTRPKVSVEGWREVLTYLVVLSAANPHWLRHARTQKDRDGVVAVNEKLQPLSAAVLISGLFDIAIRLDGTKPAGHIPVARGRGAKGHDSRDRFEGVKTFLQDEYRKYFTPDTEALDERGIKEMLLHDRKHNNPRFVYLPEGDSLAHEISQQLEGLVTVLLEKKPPRVLENDGESCVLDQSLRLVRNIQELLEKLK
jgi:hypothetical protein